MNNKITLNLTVNDKKITVKTFQMARLLDILRDDANLTSAKEGCGEGECGACYVFLNDSLVNSCLVPAAQLNGAKIKTIEGFHDDKIFEHIKNAFLKKGGAQCGFCTPGVIMATIDLFNRTLHPTTDEIKEALSGNICRCTGYTKITDSIIETIANIKG